MSRRSWFTLALVLSLLFVTSECLRESATNVESPPSTASPRIRGGSRFTTKVEEETTPFSSETRSIRRGRPAVTSTPSGRDDENSESTTLKTGRDRRTEAGRYAKVSSKSTTQRAASGVNAIGRNRLSPPRGRVVEHESDLAKAASSDRRFLSEGRDRRGRRLDSLKSELSNEVPTSSSSSDRQRILSRRRNHNNDDTTTTTPTTTAPQTTTTTSAPTTQNPRTRPTRRTQTTLSSSSKESSSSSRGRRVPERNTQRSSSEETSTTRASRRRITERSTTRRHDSMSSSSESGSWSVESTTLPMTRSSSSYESRSSESRKAGRRNPSAEKTSTEVAGSKRRGASKYGKYSLFNPGEFESFDPLGEVHAEVTTSTTRPSKGEQGNPEDNSKFIKKLFASREKSDKTSKSSRKPSVSAKSRNETNKSTTTKPEINISKSKLPGTIPKNRPKLGSKSPSKPSGETNKFRSFRQEFIQKTSTQSSKTTPGATTPDSLEFTIPAAVAELILNSTESEDTKEPANKRQTLFLGSSEISTFQFPTKMKEDYFNRGLGFRGRKHHFPSLSPSKVNPPPSGVGNPGWTLHRKPYHDRQANTGATTPPTTSQPPTPATPAPTVATQPASQQSAVNEVVPRRQQIASVVLKIDREITSDNNYPPAFRARLEQLNRSDQAEAGGSSRINDDPMLTTVIRHSRSIEYQQDTAFPDNDQYPETISPFPVLTTTLMDHEEPIDGTKKRQPAVSISSKSREKLASARKLIKPELKSEEFVSSERTPASKRIDEVIPEGTTTTAPLVKYTRTSKSIQRGDVRVVETSRVHKARPLKTTENPAGVVQTTKPYSQTSSQGPDSTTLKTVTHIINIPTSTKKPRHWNAPHIDKNWQPPSERTPQASKPSSTRKPLTLRPKPVVAKTSIDRSSEELTPESTTPSGKVTHIIKIPTSTKRPRHWNAAYIDKNWHDPSDRVIEVARKSAAKPTVTSISPDDLRSTTEKSAQPIRRREFRPRTATYRRHSDGVIAKTPITTESESVAITPKAATPDPSESTANLTQQLARQESVVNISVNGTDSSDTNSTGISFSNRGSSGSSDSNIFNPAKTTYLISSNASLLEQLRSTVAPLLSALGNKTPIFSAAYSTVNPGNFTQQRVTPSGSPPRFSARYRGAELFIRKPSGPDSSSGSTTPLTTTKDNGPSPQITISSPGEPKVITFYQALETASITNEVDQQTTDAPRSSQFNISQVANNNETISDVTSNANNDRTESIESRVVVTTVDSLTTVDATLAPEITTTSQLDTTLSPSTVGSTEMIQDETTLESDSSSTVSSTEMIQEVTSPTSSTASSTGMIQEETTPGSVTSTSTVLNSDIPTSTQSTEADVNIAESSSTTELSNEIDDVTEATTTEEPTTIPNNSTADVEVISFARQPMEILLRSLIDSMVKNEEITTTEVDNLISEITTIMSKSESTSTSGTTSESTTNMPTIVADTTQSTTTTTAASTSEASSTPDVTTDPATMVAETTPFVTTTTVASSETTPILTTTTTVASSTETMTPAATTATPEASTETASSTEATTLVAMEATTTPDSMTDVPTTPEDPFLFIRTQFSENIMNQVTEVTPEGSTSPPSTESITTDPVTTLTPESTTIPNENDINDIDPIVFNEMMKRLMSIFSIDSGSQILESASANDDPAQMLGGFLDNSDRDITLENLGRVNNNVESTTLEPLTTEAITTNETIFETITTNETMSETTITTNETMYETTTPQMSTQSAEIPTTSNPEILIPRVESSDELSNLNTTNSSPTTTEQFTTTQFETTPENNPTTLMSEMESPNSLAGFQDSTPATAQTTAGTEQIPTDAPTTTPIPSSTPSETPTSTIQSSTLQMSSTQASAEITSTMSSTTSAIPTTTNAGRFGPSRMTPAPRGSSSSSTVVPLRDYHVYGIYPNKTIVRKRPEDNLIDARNIDSPYVIFGIFPDGKLVRKYPNGTVIPDPPSNPVEIVFSLSTTTSSTLTNRPINQYDPNQTINNNISINNRVMDIVMNVPGDSNGNRSQLNLGLSGNAITTNGGVLPNQLPMNVLPGVGNDGNQSASNKMTDIVPNIETMRITNGSSDMVESTTSGPPSSTTTPSSVNSQGGRIIQDREKDKASRTKEAGGQRSTVYIGQEKFINYWSDDSANNTNSTVVSVRINSVTNAVNEASQASTNGAALPPLDIISKDQVGSPWKDPLDQIFGITTESAVIQASVATNTIEERRGPITESPINRLPEVFTPAPITTTTTTAETAAPSVEVTTTSTTSTTTLADTTSTATTRPTTTTTTTTTTAAPSTETVTISSTTYPTVSQFTTTNLPQQTPFGTTFDDLAFLNSLLQANQNGNVDTPTPKTLTDVEKLLANRILSLALGKAGPTRSPKAIQKSNVALNSLDTISTTQSSSSSQPIIINLLESTSSVPVVTSTTSRSTPVTWKPTGTVATTIGNQLTTKGLTITTDLTPSTTTQIPWLFPTHPPKTTTTTTAAPTTTTTARPTTTTIRTTILPSQKPTKKPLPRPKPTQQPLGFGAGLLQAIFGRNIFAPSTTQKPYIRRPQVAVQFATLPPIEITPKTTTTTTTQKTTTTTTYSPEDDAKFLVELLKATSGDKKPAKASAVLSKDDESFLRAILKGQATMKTPTPGTGPPSEAALLAELLKSQGIVPATPVNNIRDQLAFVGKVTTDSPMTVPTTRATTTRPRPPEWAPSSTYPPPLFSNFNFAGERPRGGGAGGGGGGSGEAIRNQMLNAAIGATRVFSQFLGAAITGAAQQLQSLVRNGTRIVSEAVG